MEQRPLSPLLGGAVSLSAFASDETSSASSNSALRSGDCSLASANEVDGLLARYRRVRRQHRQAPPLALEFALEVFEVFHRLHGNEHVFVTSTLDAKEP